MVAAWEHRWGIAHIDVLVLEPGVFPNEPGIVRVFERLEMSHRRKGRSGIEGVLGLLVRGKVLVRPGVGVGV
jgi:hypothetical protein